jgi:hypothetical protein
MEATTKRPGWRNRSNLCLSMLRSSVEKMGLGRTQKAFQSNYYTQCRITLMAPNKMQNSFRTYMG